LDQSSQGGQVEHVEVAAAGGEPLRSFQNKGDMAEPMVGKKMAESVAADKAFADMFMSVNMAAQVGAGVIDMNYLQFRQANGLVEFPHCISIGRFRTKVVAGSEDVAGVEANSQSAGMSRGGNYLGYLGKGMAEAGSLAGGGFQDDFAV